MKWLNRLYMGGHHLSKGEKFCAAFLFFHPNFGKKGRRNTARVWRALKGWKRKSPPRSRKPRTWPEIAAIANRLVMRGEFMKAVWVLLCFGGYLRPSDALRLRRQDFVAPVPGVNGKFWCLVLSTSEFEEKSKTGISNESMI